MAKLLFVLATVAAEKTFSNPGVTEEETFLNDAVTTTPVPTRQLGGHDTHSAGSDDASSESASDGATTAAPTTIEGDAEFVAKVPDTCDETSDYGDGASDLCVAVHQAFELGTCKAMKAALSGDNAAAMVCEGTGKNFESEVALSRRMLAEAQRALAAVDKTVTLDYTVSIPAGTTATALATSIVDALVALDATVIANAIVQAVVAEVAASTALTAAGMEVTGVTLTAPTVNDPSAASQDVEDASMRSILVGTSAMAMFAIAAVFA